MAKKETKVDTEKVIELIKEGTSASDIQDETNISRPTLKNVVLRLCQKDGAFYDVPGLVGRSAKRSIKYTKNGLKISNTRMEESNFTVNDEFDLEFEDKRIILTKV